MLDASTYIASYGSVFGNLATFFVLLLPEDATPEEGVERPETDAPDPDHVVEEKQKDD
jgi:hypothetical protein